MRIFAYLDREYARHHVCHNFIREDAVVNSVLVCLTIRKSSHVDYVHADHETHDTEDEEKRREDKHDRCED